MVYQNSKLQEGWKIIELGFLERLSLKAVDAEEALS
jgi:hypothetical protein